VMGCDGICCDVWHPRHDVISRYGCGVVVILVDVI
jgi:hypothetical protein